MLIEFIGLNGGLVWVNPEKIVAAAQANIPSTGSTCIEIELDYNNALRVKDSPLNIGTIRKLCDVG